MKKKIIGIILAGMMIVTACGNSGNTEPSEVTEGRTESGEEASNVEESTEESSVVEEDSANNKFAQKAVEKSGKTIEDVRDIISKDFDGDGKEEAFVFIGNEPDEEFGECTGTLWFVSDDKCEEALPEEYVVYHDGRILNEITTEDEIFVEINKNYTTSAVSYLFYVDGGECHESIVSGLGSFYEPDYVDDYCISMSAYDVYFEYEEGKEDEAMITGHSWKNYYFYYDKAAGDFAEFEATEITEQELNEAVGTDLASEIRAEGYDIDNIIKRDNGVINVNYSKTTKNDDGTILKECKNITYLTKEGRYFDVWGTGEETWQNSDFGGIYDVMLTK